MNRPHPFPGFLIALEGIDGAGKTTQGRFLQERLEARGLRVVRTREPTAGRWGQLLRDSAVKGRLSLQEETEAFIKDREEHVETVLHPALREGKVVIIDRYYFSTMAYQGARGLDPLELMRRNEAFAPEPDLLVVFDIDPKGGRARIKLRGDQADLFEQTEALEKARAIFNSVSKPYLFRVDATLAPEVLRDLIEGRFWTVYKERGAV
jgi:dTMP kinase